jgi:hypothetical protein
VIAEAKGSTLPTPKPSSDQDYTNFSSLTAWLWFIAKLSCLVNGSFQTQVIILIILCNNATKVQLNVGTIKVVWDQNRAGH